MLNSLAKIVIEASHLMQTENFSISQKHGNADIVTSSDLAVQDYLRHHLGTLLPGCGFICEEEDRHDTEHDFLWIVDPIDGTANYSRGIRECAVCTGLLHGRTMEMAAIYLPRTDELFTAKRGEGAYLQLPHSDQPARQIHVSGRPFADAIMCTALPVYHKEYASICSEIIRETFLRCNDIRRFGSAASELCYLATGRCELYFEYLLSPWDFAAASLILEEAGGLLCNLEGLPLDYTQPSGILAANNQANLNRLVEITQHKRQLT